MKNDEIEEYEKIFKKGKEKYPNITIEYEVTEDCGSGSQPDYLTAFIMIDGKEYYRNSAGDSDMQNIDISKYEGLDRVLNILLRNEGIIFDKTDFKYSYERIELSKIIK